LLKIGNSRPHARRIATPTARFGTITLACRLLNLVDNNCGPGVEAGCRWRPDMLETIAVLLIILWLLGLVSGYTLGNFIYILLVIALVLIVVRLVSGRRV
jgi:hypothetical protein